MSNEKTRPNSTIALQLGRVRYTFYDEYLRGQPCIGVQHVINTYMVPIYNIGKNLTFTCIPIRIIVYYYQLS